MTITEEVELLFGSLQAHMLSCLRNMAPINALVAGFLARSLMFRDFATQQSLGRVAIVLSLVQVLYMVTAAAWAPTNVTRLTIP